MKRISALVTAMLLLLLLSVPTAVSAQEDRTTYSFAEYADSVKLIGRTDVNDTGIVPHTTASGIAFYSDCSGSIDLTIKGSKTLFDAQYFIVYVDGVIHKRIELDHRIKGRTVIETLTVAEDLEPGLHRIEILRETEEINAQCEFLNITLNGTMTPLADAPMLIEFVGDSITTGYGAYPFSYADKGDPVDHPSRQAGTKSYAYLTARELGMDIQVCCTSGYGAQVGWNGDGVNMQDMYEYTAFHHNRQAEWSFARTADIVVINLGTNDNGARKNKGVSEAKVLEGMKNLTQIVKTRNPDAKIVWATGMMGITFKKGITEMVEELGGAEAGYYFCILPTGMSGGAGHPDEAQHAAAAETLVGFLKTNVLPEDYTEQYATAEEMESLLKWAAFVPNADDALARTELTAFVASEAEVSGTMTTVYASLKQQVMQTAVIAGAVLIGIAVVLTVFIVVHKRNARPQDAKETPDTLPEQADKTEEKGE